MGAAPAAAEGDMVDLRETDAAARRASIGPDRGAAFRAAKVHSSRVRRLRVAIIAGCALAGLGLLGRAFYDPFAKAPDKLSLANATLNGTRVTMEQPSSAATGRMGAPMTSAPPLACRTSAPPTSSS